MTSNDQIILVDEQDNPVGLMEKLQAHKDKGTLHRAISVLLYRRGKKGLEVLLQKRSQFKPLWPLFWGDTASSHPRDGESYEDCAVRRLKEEMGVSIGASELKLVFKLVYLARYNQKLSEREVDGILVGEWDGEVKPKQKEVIDYKWVKWSDLVKQVESDGVALVPWLKLMIKDNRLQKKLLKEVVINE